MLTLFAWLVLVYLGGLLNVLSFAGRVRSIIAHAAAIPAGLILYVLTFRLLRGSGSPWMVAGVIGAFGVLMLAVGRLVRGDVPGTRFAAVRFTRTDWIIVAVIFGFFVAHSLTFVGNDEINHFYFASQIAQGQFPPCAYGFPTVPAKYHYGWDILLASVIRVSHLSHPVASDVLTAYSLLGAVPLVFCVLNYLGASAGLRALCGASFFVGDGLAGIAAYLSQGEYRRYLTLTNLYHQHPWTLAIGLFLLSLILLDYCTTARRMRAFLFGLAWLLILYAAAPLGSASMIPVAGLALAAIALRSVLAGRRQAVVRCLATAAIGLLLIVLWPGVGGIMIEGVAYDRPAIHLAISVLGASGYLRYETAYALMMPVALVVLGYGAVRVLRREVAVRSQGAVHIMLWLCVLVLIPCPMIAMVENSAYWDNFCKFNFVGMLAAWLLLPTVMVAARRSAPIVRMVLSGLVSVSFITAVVVAGQVIAETAARGPVETLMASSRGFAHAVAAEDDLIECVSRQVDWTSNILIADNRVSTMFPVSPTSNRAGIDQYKYFTRYFGQFKVVPQITGRSVINFYDYNFFYARDAESAMAKAMSRVFSGDADALKGLNVSHVLCSCRTAPPYLADWERTGRVRLVTASEAEGWRLYRNTSCH